MTKSVEIYYVFLAVYLMASLSCRSDLSEDEYSVRRGKKEILDLPKEIEVFDMRLRHDGFTRIVDVRDKEGSIYQIYLDRRYRSKTLYRLFMLPKGESLEGAEYSSEAQKKIVALLQSWLDRNNPKDIFKNVTAETRKGAMKKERLWFGVKWILDSAEKRKIGK